MLAKIEKQLSGADINDDPTAWCVALYPWTGIGVDDKGSPGQINEYCSTYDHDGDGLEGLVVTTSPPSDLALVDAPGAEFGFAPGSTLLRDSTFVMFGNQPATPVSVAFNPPASESCLLAPAYTSGPVVLALTTDRRTHFEVACR
jgi:hypothetical protein